MELSKREFNGMNHPLRLFCQRKIEYPLFLQLGCDITDKVVLEIGCGSGYGAALLLEKSPRSYTGIDLMPEQIDLALKRKLKEARFTVHDAADLSFLADQSVDVIVDFGILHHIPEWQKVLKECNRVLKAGGEFYIEEPDIRTIDLWDKLFHWGHPGDAIFSFKSFEKAIISTGFLLDKIKNRLFFRFYKAIKAVNS